MQRLDVDREGVSVYLDVTVRGFFYGQVSPTDLLTPTQLSFSFKLVTVKVDSDTSFEY